MVMPEIELKKFSNCIYISFYIKGFHEQIVANATFIGKKTR